jgi:hypothetical protein
MFLRAGFNPRHRRTGIRAVTQSIHGGRAAPAELIVFLPSTDLCWYGTGAHGFLAWGEACVFHSRPEIRLEWKHQYGLKQCRLQDRPTFLGQMWAQLKLPGIPVAA